MMVHWLTYLEMFRKFLSTGENESITLVLHKLMNTADRVQGKEGMVLTHF